MRILVIEDDAGIAAGLRTTLQQRGYAVDVCGDVANAWSALRTERFDAVLLDLGLPDADGSVLLQRLRSAPATVGASGAALPNPATPVLIVTARDQVQQRIAGLDMGADDYVAKPFAPRELVARVRALLRRSVLTERATAQKKRISYPGIEIDMPTRSVLVEGEAVHLTPKEFDLLFHLASRPRRVFTREEIVEDVWGYSPPGGDLRTVDTHVKRLRKKLEEGRDVPWSLATVWGVGYKFEIGE